MRNKIDELRARLLAFFDTSRRDLPWRRDRHDAYRVWTAEVMLQQTRVDAVIPYYRRFLERFPDVECLADADLDDVLRVWQGLGYYARARNLHRAARVVKERHGGRMPRDLEALRRLPGVGDYTAGAVASIAFGLPAPAVDGNARRVLCRLFDFAAPAPAELRRLAAELVDPDRPGDFNQALMELGATVCTAREPACGCCPVAAACGARANGTVADRPTRRGRRAIPSVEIAAAIVRTDGAQVLLVRRPESGLLGGLWEFPAEALRAGENPLAAAARAASQRGVRLRSSGRPLPPVARAFSHLKAVYRPVLFRLRRPRPEADGRWVAIRRLGTLALPAAQRRIAELL